GGGGPAVLEIRRERAEGGAAGRFVEVAARDSVFHTEAREAVEQQAALLTAFVRVQAQMAAEDAEAGGAVADDRRGESAAVPARGEGEEDVFGALHGGAEAAQQGGTRGGSSSGEDDQVGVGREPGQFFPPAEEAGGFLDEYEIGGAGGDDAGQGGG